VVERIKHLRDLGLTSKQVVADFLALRLVPLQQRSHPTWEFTGPRDPTCLWRGRTHPWLRTS
jgi:hypothetical protein